eukprot:5025828-Prymnesium_polylepis.1
MGARWMGQAYGENKKGLTLPKRGLTAAESVEIANKKWMDTLTVEQHVRARRPSSKVTRSSSAALLETLAAASDDGVAAGEAAGVEQVRPVSPGEVSAGSGRRPDSPTL